MVTDLKRIGDLAIDICRVVGDMDGRVFDRSIDAQDAVDLLMIAKCYERIGDHAESIAYWTEYVVKGTRKGEPFTMAN